MTGSNLLWMTQRRRFVWGCAVALSGIVFCVGCGPIAGGSGANDNGGTSTGVTASSSAGATTSSDDAGTTSTSESQCDVVVLPDPAVDEAVRDALGIPNGPISADAMASLAHLEEVYGVESLEGIECAVNLESLEVGFDLLLSDAAVDLSPVGSLAELRTFELVATPHGEEVVDLSPLETLGSLEVLRLRRVILSNLAPLSGLANLTELELASDVVSDLGPIASMTQLETLSLSGSQVTDLGPVSSLKGLQELTLNGTGVDDLEPLSALDSLRRLYATGNAIVDVGPLAELSQLEELNLSNNAIVDLSPLAGLPALVHLEVALNQIEDISPLASFSQLGFVSLYKNQIVDMSPLLGVTWELPGGCGDLWVDANPLSEESKYMYNQQICSEAGIYIDAFCGECQNSCFDMCACRPDDPNYPC